MQKAKIHGQGAVNNLYAMMFKIFHKKTRTVIWAALLFIFAANSLRAQQGTVSIMCCPVTPTGSSKSNFSITSLSFVGNQATVTFSYALIVSNQCHVLASSTSTINFGDQSPNYMSSNLANSTFSSNSSLVVTTYTASHVYNLPNICAPAVYSLNLTTKDDIGWYCNETRTITIQHPGINFNMSASNQGCSTVNFSYTSNWPILNGQWIYGNNVASTIIPNPVPNTTYSYSYPAAGTYTAYFTAAGIAPCIASVQVNIPVFPGTNFTYSVLNACGASSPSLAISISNYSSSGVSYSLQVNNSSNPIPITSQNSTLASVLTGTMNTVSLIMTNGTCTSVNTKTVPTSLLPNYAITMSVAPMPNCKTRQFTYTGLPALSNVQWSFGDGNYSQIFAVGGNSITHTYPSAGTYVVSLNSPDLGTCPVQTTVNISDFTTPGFNYTITNLCSATSGIVLSIPSYDNQTYSYQWQINNLYVACTGQSANYISGLVNGANTIKLTVTENSTGCTVSVIKIINIGSPVASFNQYTNNVCIGDPLSVYNLAAGGGAYSWSITNSAATFTFPGMNPAYNFTTAGTHTVALSITTTLTSGGQSAVCTSSAALNVTVNAIPTANFSLTPLSCNKVASLSIIAPTGPFITYTLNYGDGTVLNGGNSISPTHLTHTYTPPASTGTAYPIVLTLVNGPCSSSYTQNVIIDNSTSLVMIAPVTNVCSGNSANIMAQVNSNAPGLGSFTYQWTGPTNFTANVQSISVNTTGLYQVTVTSTGNCALSLSGSQSITVLAAANATLLNVNGISCLNGNPTASLAISADLQKDGFVVNGTTVAANPAASGTLQYVVSGLVQGANYVTITNALSEECNSSVLVNINQNDPTMSVAVTQPTSCGSLGSALVSVTPPNGTLSWYTLANYPTTPITSNTTATGMSNLVPGSYVVKNVYGNCTTTANITIIGPVINISKKGGAGTCGSGAVTAVTLGAQFFPQNNSASFNYTLIKATGTGTTLIGGPSATNVYSVDIGTYSIIASANGCSKTSGFSVVKYDSITVKFYSVAPNCSAPAVVSAVPSGGNGNYNYKWFVNGIQTTNTTNVLSFPTVTATQNVSVTVFDYSGCSASVPSPAIVFNPVSQVSLTACTGSTLQGLQNATKVTPCQISACVIGGLAPYTFEWFKSGSDEKVVEWRFRYFNNKFIAYNGSDTVLVSTPTDSNTASLNLGYNSDMSIATASYPYWNYSATPSFTPELNSVGLAALGTTPVTSTNPDYYYSKLERVTIASQEVIASYSGNSGHAISNEKFTNGNYMLVVTDANGCKYTFAIGTLTFAPATGNAVAFSFVWGMDKKEVEEESDPILAENMIEAANELATQAEKCMAGKMAALKGYLKNDCSDLDKFKDRFDVSYVVKEHHYTLYYYDRAGRLTKTVPPQGVAFLLPADINTIKNSRRATTIPGPSAASAWPVLTHSITTTYSYNTLGQLIKQNTPDGGLTSFIYDSKNRLRFSQNGKQKNMTAYSYTKYDNLGRIIEVGESLIGSLGLDFVTTTTVNTMLADQLTFPSVNTPGVVLREVTRTVYSTPSAVTYYGKPQRYTQNRVSYTYVDENPAIKGGEYYTYYSYDSHGNVEWLAQYDANGQGINYVAYEYDLVSGKVLTVKYNEKRDDRFFHRYVYDAENRLVRTETSRNGEIWDKDAQYEYYAHGPLKRATLGEDKVQGLDYIYTIHGWIKSVNSPKIDPASDPGKDNDNSLFASNPVARTAADRFGMLLNYYQNDYITNSNNYLSTNAHYNLPVATPTNGMPAALYNGNIAMWIQSQLNSTGGVGGISPRADMYNYDILNRINTSRSIAENTVGNNWTSVDNSVDTYKSEYNYDRNGNILSLKRYATNGALMDNLAYTYDNGSGGVALNKNHLTAVSDAVTTTLSGMQDLQGTHNYTYDPTGNLILETGQELVALGTNTTPALYSFTTNINWTVYGKIKSTYKAFVVGSITYGERISFTYDAAGNRVTKEYWKDSYTQPDQIIQPSEVTTTWYVRDAQGNTMATYQRYFDVATSNFKIDLIEQPIYGSSRLGQNTRRVTLSTSSNYASMQMPGNGSASYSEYQNWITTTNRTSLLPGNSGNNDYLCQCKVLQLKDNGSPNYNNISTAVSMLGIANNGVAVAEDLNRNLQFYVVLAEKYLGSKNTCLVFDKDGKLMAGSDLIGEVDVNCKPIIINLPGSSNYAVVTLSANTGQAMYHIVDMSTTGYGPLGNSGSVVVANQPLDNTMGTTTHGLHFTGVEDHVNNSSKIFATRYKPDVSNPGSGTSEIITYDFGTFTVTPTKYVINSVYGCGDTKQGQLQVSPDGTRLLWWRPTEKIAGFAHRRAEIRIMPLNSIRTGLSGTVLTKTISEAGSYGNGMLEFMKNSSDLMYSQRGVYKDGLGADSLKHERNVWKYDPVNFSFSAINPSNPLISYLYGEIKRGIDGNYYIPNMGKKSTNIHSYSGASYNNYPYNVDTMYKLSSSLPTQVYKVFDNSGLKYYQRNVGNKSYELNDHLGNVRVVLSDSKIITDNGTLGQLDPADSFQPEVRSSMAYYPFGMKMPGTEFYAGAKPRYDYNGKETDQESGTQDYGMRIYDSRLGKFLSVDPITKEYPELTPYQFAGNMPIVAIDLDGLEPAIQQPDGRYTTPRDGNLARDVPKEAMDQFTPKGESPKLGPIFKIAADVLTPIGEDINTLFGVGEGAKSSAFDKAMAAGNLLLLGVGGEGRAGAGAKGGKFISPNVEGVLGETTANIGKGKITSQYKLTESELLDAGIKHVGADAKELGGTGSGVYRSKTQNADGTHNQFRMDNNSIEGNHTFNDKGTKAPHGHLEQWKEGARKPEVNNHVEIEKDK